MHKRGLLFFVIPMKMCPTHQGCFLFKIINSQKTPKTLQQAFNSLQLQFPSTRSSYPLFSSLSHILYSFCLSRLCLCLASQASLNCASVQGHSNKHILSIPVSGPPAWIQVQPSTLQEKRAQVKLDYLSSTIFLHCSTVSISNKE